MWLSSLVGGSTAKGGIGRRLNFEVQAYKVDHWVIEEICASEEEAKAVATRLLPLRDGVRIVRDFTGAPGMPPTQTILFSEMRDGQTRAITVQPVDEAPLCMESTDYLQEGSRQVISRMLRQYLEERSLTASELLYNASEMRRAFNYENMVPIAVGRVATVQGKAASLDMRQRRDQIYASLTELQNRADTAQKRAPFSIRQDGFTTAMAKAAALGAGDPATVDYLSKVVFCRDLVQIRNLLGKVEWLLETAADAANGPASHLAIIDTLVADAISFPSVVQDLLGRQPDLGTALGRLLDVLDGQFETDGRESAPAITGILSRWLGTGQAPQSWQVMFESLLRSLRGTAPLARDPQRNRTAFSQLTARVITPSGFMGGSRMAEALTSGYLRFLEQGGTEGRRLSIDGMLGIIALPRDRALYLTELADSDLGRREMDTLVARLRPLLGRGMDVNALVGAQVPLKPKMQAMAALYRALGASGLPGEEAERLADQVDGMVADYIVAARVIEKLDDPGASLRVRATRLMQFAANDVLSSPKARRMVRDQIVGHLRQPNFDGKFVEGLSSPQEQAQALRNFHNLLRQADFV